MSNSLVRRHLFRLANDNKAFYWHKFCFTYIKIPLLAAEDVTSINTVVHGKIMGVEMPFHLQNPDACVDSGLTCPLSKDASYEYKATLPVLKAYPKVHMW